MPSITYTLRIEVPAEIDADTLAEIADGAEPHDKTPRARTERYLGGFVSDAAAQLSAWLPEGFYAKVDAVKEHEGFSGAYPISDPKHPEYHSTHADLWDMREGK